MSRHRPADAAAPPARPRTPVDIEHLLVWTYRVQRADLVLRHAGRLLPQEAAADGEAPAGGSNVAAVGRILELGTFIDGGGPDSGALHPDAETVHLAVSALRMPAAGLPLGRMLIGYARQAIETPDGWWYERPDPMVGAIPRPVPLRRPSGEVVVEWSDKGRRCGTCPLEYEPSAVNIAAARLEYAWWHAGMRALAATLDGRLAQWHALPPALPSQPWGENRG